jgi:hypothetical protein
VSASGAKILDRRRDHLAGKCGVTACLIVAFDGAEHACREEQLVAGSLSYLDEDAGIDRFSDVEPCGPVCDVQ